MSGANYTTLQLGDNTVRLLTYKNCEDLPSNNSFCYFHPHQDEVTSVQATEEIINKHGGTLLSIEYSDPPTRNLDFTINSKKYSIDPNRMFSRIGIEKNLDTSDPAVIDIVEGFAQKIAKMVLADIQHDIVLAVHNNYNQNYSVKSYEPGHSLAGDVAKLYINPQQGTGEFFYVTEDRIFEIIKSGGYNVVLQDKDKVVDDGSFSVYAQKNNLSYINVESQRNNYDQQLDMMDFAVTHIL